MKIALIDSGIGLLAAAAALRRMRPDASLVLASDPGGMPWGPRTPEDITARARACARAAAAQRPDALIVACNTATVHALDALRAEFEPDLPVVGTVPAVKPAAAGGGPLAVWATPATTASPYQRRLIREFAAGTPATPVPCHGLADAIERADDAAIDAALAAAAALTPPDTRALVLGCTHYPFLARTIGDVMGRDVVLVSSADETAFEVRSILADTGLGRRTAGKGAHRFVSSGDVAWFRELGSRLLGPELDGVEGWSWPT